MTTNRTVVTFFILLISACSFNKGKSLTVVNAGGSLQQSQLPSGVDPLSPTASTLPPIPPLAASPLPGVSLVWKLEVVGPSAVPTGYCSKFTLVLEAEDHPHPLAEDLPIALSATGLGKIYSNSGCTSLISSVSLVAGNTTIDFYLKDMASEPVTLKALSAVANGTKIVDVKTGAILLYTGGADAQFGPVQSGSFVDRLITFTNVGDKVATLTSAFLTVGAFQFKGGGFPGTGGTCGPSLSPGFGCTVAIRFSPTGAGDFQSDLTLNYTDPLLLAQSVTVLLSGKGFTDPCGGLAGSYDGFCKVMASPISNPSFGIEVELISREGRCIVLDTVVSKEAPLTLKADGTGEASLPNRESNSPNFGLIVRPGLHFSLQGFWNWGVLNCLCHW